MKISADSSKGRLNCGQTHGKIYSDYLNNFVLIEIVSRGDRVFTNPDQEKKKKRGTACCLGTHKGDKPLKFLSKGIY